MRSQHLPKSIKLSLPHSHRESNDVHWSSAILYGKGDEDDTADCQASAVRCKSVIQFVVGDAEFFVVDLPDDGTDIETGKV